MYKSPICIFTFLKVLFSEQSYCFISETFLNRIFRVALLFICQGSACSCLTQLHYFIIRFEVCQELFEIFLFLTTAASAVDFHINMFFHFCQYVFLIYFYVVSAGRKKRILMLLRFLFYIS